MCVFWAVHLELTYRHPYTASKVREIFKDWFFPTCPPLPWLPMAEQGFECKCSEFYSRDWWLQCSVPGASLEVDPEAVADPGVTPILSQLLNPGSQLHLGSSSRYWCLPIKPSTMWYLVTNQCISPQGHLPMPPDPLRLCFAWWLHRRRPEIRLQEVEPFWWWHHLLGINSQWSDACPTPFLLLRSCWNYSKEAFEVGLFWIVLPLLYFLAPFGRMMHFFLACWPSLRYLNVFYVNCPMLFGAVSNTTVGSTLA